MWAAAVLEACHGVKASALQAPSPPAERTSCVVHWQPYILVSSTVYYTVLLRVQHTAHALLKYVSYIRVLYTAQGEYMCVYDSTHYAAATVAAAAAAPS